ncbi:MAG TPA: CoA pyrophosphatase [Spirochaetota bacterium]|nr:CoA pyrophosphatase [Spirochaetota bacterium]HQO39561.1 CoA pyrophosphatase [Spirochaetota bacterium]
MNIRFDRPVDFEVFKESIRDKLKNRAKRSINFSDYRRAAVMMLFFEKDGSPHVLLQLRTDRVSTHKGQVSMPGGGFENTDRDLLYTALRETQEETGIEPSLIEVIGEFDEYISIMGFQVNVFVGALNSKVDYSAFDDETEQILEVPFELFYNENFYKCEKLNHEGREYDVYFYDFNGITVWGMTARILTDFSRKICRNNQD